MLLRKSGFSLIIIFVLFLILTGCTTKQVPEAPKINAKAPAFSVSDLENNKLILSDLDKPVIIAFWKIDSPSSLRQLKDLQAIQNKYGDKLIIMAFNVEDNPSRVIDFQNNYDYTFHIIIDKEGQISSKYKLSLLPTTFLTDEDGIIKGVTKYESLTVNNQSLKDLLE